MVEHGLESPWIEKKTCPKCQQENEPGRDFCWACHGKLPEEGGSSNLEGGSPELEGGSPELEEAPYSGGLRLEKNSSSLSDQPQDAPSPGGPQPDQGIPPLYGPREESPLLQGGTKKEGHRLFPQVTDLQSAADAAKQGVWAAGIVAVITISIALISLATGTSVIGLDGSAILDGLAFALIAWGIHRKSRTASVGGLALYVLEQLLAVADGESIRGGIIIIFFLIAFGNSIRGTFAYHRFHAQLRSAIDPETGLPTSKIPELPSFPMPVKLLGGAFLSGCIMLVLLGLLLPEMPETYVLEGDQLSTDQRATIESLGLLKPSERILYFYSDGFWDMKEGFYMLTDQALILWGEAFLPEGRVLAPAVWLPLSEITFIGVHYSDSWLEDSAVGVDSGGWNYYFPLSSENGGDRSFITALEKATGVKSAMLEQADFD